MATPPTTSRPWLTIVGVVFAGITLFGIVYSTLRLEGSFFGRITQEGATFGASAKGSDPVWLRTAFSESQRVALPEEAMPAQSGSRPVIFNQK